MSIAKITPPGWHPHKFDSIENVTAYFLTRLDNKTVIQAVSHTSASAYYNPVTVSPAEFPVIHWQWQIQHVIKKGDVNTRAGDDYAARIYISFEYDTKRLSGLDRVKYNLYKLLHDKPPPLAVLNYIWANRSPIGTIVNNAYSDRVKMIVIQSGNANAGKWIHEQRNIVEDYTRAFGEQPGNINGIAIMTDTDNTGESAIAWYGDITFSKMTSPPN